MSFAITRGTHIVDCNGQVRNSTITNSTVDMNGGVISSHGTPVNGSDVVNKDYVDGFLVGGVPSVTITLTGVTYTSIISTQSGSILLLIKNLVTNGPAATFLLSKSEAGREASVARFTSSDGLNTNEKLDVRWDPNTGIELHKTGLNYDGQYRIKYILM